MVSESNFGKTMDRAHAADLTAPANRNIIQRVARDVKKLKSSTSINEPHDNGIAGSSGTR